LSRNDPVPTKPVAAMSYGGRVRIARLHKSYEEFIGKTIRVAGWAKNARGQKEMCFVEINDGSCFSSLQVVVDKSSKDFDEISKTIVGASLQFTGTLIKSPAKGQQFELSINDNAEHGAKLIGNTDSTYPIQGRPTLETLRSNLHLRARTNTFGALARVRNNLAYATHQFFQSRGFLYVHTPIITASDCEGAGEMFAVTTTLPAAHEPVSKAVLQNKLKTRKTDAEIEAIKQERKQKIEEAAAAAAAA